MAVTANMSFKKDIHVHVGANQICFVPSCFFILFFCENGFEEKKVSEPNARKGMPSLQLKSKLSYCFSGIFFVYMCIIPPQRLVVHKAELPQFMHFCHLFCPHTVKER